MTNYDGFKSPKIVTSKVVREKITFRGKKITRDRVVKEWNIPKVINSDIGFQMMFGFRSTKHLKPKSNGGLTERTVEY